MRRRRLPLKRHRLLTAYTLLLERELEANAYKGDDWAYEDAFEVLYHAAKLALAVQAGDVAAIRELAADVGNEAAILADSVGALHVVPSAEDVAVASAGYARDGGPGATFGAWDLKRDVQTWMDALLSRGKAAPR